MSAALIIGVGNPYRRDDGVGIAAIERLREAGLTAADLVEESGEPVALVLRWTGHETVTLVDAVDSGSPAGTLHRFECIGGHWDATPQSRAVSTHGLGIADAVELGRVLDRLPAHLFVFGIEVETVADGVGLSPPVASALDTLVAELAGRPAGAAEVGL